MSCALVHVLARIDQQLVLQSEDGEGGGRREEGEKQEEKIETGRYVHMFNSTFETDQTVLTTHLFGRVVGHHGTAQSPLRHILPTNAEGVVGGER